MPALTRAAVQQVREEDQDREYAKHNEAEHLAIIPLKVATVASLTGVRRIARSLPETTEYADVLCTTPHFNGYPAVLVRCRGSPLRASAGMAEQAVGHCIDKRVPGRSDDVLVDADR